LWLLFAGTGAIQDVAESSGWGEEFIALADRFDIASDRAYRTRLIAWLRRLALAWR